LRIVHIIDSLEINGGSTMCFEMASAMRRLFDDWVIECLVVSKTGKYGRKSITAEKIAQSYGWSMPSMKYEDFHRRSADYQDCVIIQHRLECSRPLKFKQKPKLYMVINHTIQSLDRLKKFKKANVIVSVCEHLRNSSPQLKASHKVILNGMAKNTAEPTLRLSNFITGRCHRLPAVKFSMNSLNFLDSLQIPLHLHYLAGPKSSKIMDYEKRKAGRTCLQYLQKLDDLEKKRELMRSLDLYFYDTYGPEGASAAILEGLAAGVPVICKPLGGNKELVKNGINGYYYESFGQAGKIIERLYRHPKELKKLKKSTEEDFDKRLSIEQCVMKYRKLMNYLIIKR